MKPTTPTQAQETQCDNCGKEAPGYDLVHYGSIEKGYRLLCGPCFNAHVAKLDGLHGFEQINLEPVRLIDCSGEAHDFHFRTRLLGPGVALDAFELRDGHPAGYQFQIIGDAEEDLLALLGRLIVRMRRALSVKHVQQNGACGLQIAEHPLGGLVRGRIEWDDSRDNERVPLLVIDGREFSWEEFGRMMMSFEGWQFRLEIRDKSEDF
jgi:hypothetical protein